MSAPVELAPELLAQLEPLIRRLAREEAGAVLRAVADRIDRGDRLHRTCGERLAPPGPGAVSAAIRQAAAELGQQPVSVDEATDSA